MSEKLDYYDILSSVIPGTLLVWWATVCFPSLSGALSSSSLPEAVQVLVAVALAMFLGQIVQAASSAIEPLLYWTWGGRPSDCALTGGLRRYLPLETAQRIKGKLGAAIGKESGTASLFLFAMRRAHASSDARVGRFNSLYAYHRGLVVLVAVALVLAVVSAFCGRLSTWSAVHVRCLLGGMGALLLLTWYRARQRAYYFVREVLLVAEHDLDAK